MNYEFSGPCFLRLGVTCAAIPIMNAIYNKFFISKSLFGLILVMREVVDCVFYQLCSFCTRHASSKQLAKTYAFTNITTNIFTLWVMRRMNLIAQTGTFVFICLIVVELFCKVHDFSKYSENK